MSIAIFILIKHVTAWGPLLMWNPAMLEFESGMLFGTKIILFNFYFASAYKTVVFSV